MFGFGEGRRTAHYDNATDRDGNRVKKTFENSMVAHVWAQYTQTFGQSGNGNFYFHGRALYSYGGHYVAGYLLPVAGNPDSVGVALFNGESYSVSTSRHVSDTRSAIRHLSPICAKEGLTESVRIIEAGIESASSTTGLARYVTPRLAKLWAERGHFVGREAACAILAACAVRNPEKRAATMAARYERAEAKREAEEAARNKAEALAHCKQAAATLPAVALAEGIRIARDANPRYYECEAELWAQQARRVFRSAKIARDAGHVAQARKATAVYKAMREALPEFESAALRATRVAKWAATKKALRNSIQMAATGERATGNGNYRAGLVGLAYEMAEGARAARSLAGYVDSQNVDSQSWAAHAARVAQVAPDVLGDRLRELAGRFDALESQAKVATDRERVRKGLADIRAAIAYDKTEGAAVPSTRAELWGAVSRFLSPYTPFTVGKNRFEPTHKLTGAARVAGWTPDSLRPLFEVARQNEKDARAAAAELTAQRIAAGKAQAFELWRAGEVVPHDLREFCPRADSDGRAFIRAVGVERDASGQITGGRLETSQGADVPLTHAIQAFRFLRACRDAGKGWQANGRTLRVGHFQVDRITAQGDFVAGCHRFAWAEVAALAERLGLSELAAKDTTESKS